MKGPLRVKVAGTLFHILGTVKGLKRERNKVKAVFDRIDPGAVGLYIHADELEGLEAVVNGSVKEMGLSRSEEIYASKLAAYGEVQVPPPSLVTAYRLAKRKGIPLIPLDMDDDEYAEAFTKYVTTFQLIRHSLRIKRLKRKSFDCPDAETFVRAWDRTINKTKGYRSVEAHRERTIADNILDIGGKYPSVLVLVERERQRGIMERIRGRTGRA